MRKSPTCSRAPSAWRSAIVGESAALRKLILTIERVGPTSLPILLLGETGTGKEVLATAVHHASGRSGPLVIANCAALTPTLIESELFGHVRGAFTGATTDRRGLILAAQGGTIFLDEAGDLPRDLQAKLLRVLEEEAVRPVGSSTPIPINVRFVAATCRDIEALLKADQFRRDLWYRLAGAVLTIPPLRERPEDIPPLVECFLTNAIKNGRLKTLPPDTLAYLGRLPWRGNVRELRHAVHRAVALGGEVLTPEDFAATPVPTRAPRTVADLLELPSWDEIERVLLTEALSTYGSVGHVVKAFGLPRSTIYDRLRRWGVSVRGNGGCLCHRTTGSTLPS